MKSIQEAVASVQNAFPSIYTKDDVIKLLESIQIESAVPVAIISRETIDELISKVQEAVTRTVDRLDTSYIVEFDSAEFEIEYGNRIKLESVDVNSDTISEEVNEKVEEAVQEFFIASGLIKDEESDVVELERGS